MNVLMPLVVLLPRLGAAVAFTQAKHPRVQTLIAVGVLSAVLVIGVALMVAVDASGAIAVDIGGWTAPFGIVLVVDRLAALLLVVSAAVLLAVLVFSVGQGLADGDRETPVSIYYPTYLILATGVFNAFIAGDLFNLYVSFEILLVLGFKGLVHHLD
jgi:multicomponent Na+:H+ antiporter subunit D